MTSFAYKGSYFTVCIPQDKNKTNNQKKKKNKQSKNNNNKKSVPLVHNFIHDHMQRSLEKGFKALAQNDGTCDK